MKIMYTNSDTMNERDNSSINNASTIIGQWIVLAALSN